jgi:hypothetical protein
MSASAVNTTRSGVFSAIVTKEIRDRLKIAFVCIAMVGIGQFISLGFQKMVESAGFGAGGSISPFSFTLFTLTSALSGLLIGRAMIVDENRGDRWGFLAHRPVRRSTLFFAKAIAGTLLYLAAAGIPLAYVTSWMASPGHRPMPWAASMALPGVADLLCGLIYLLVAMLVSMREARWYGSRFLPLGAALACSIVVLEASHFWQALAAIAIGIAIVGIAALTTFDGGGQYQPLSRWGRATLALTILPGLVFAGGFVLGVTALALFSRTATRDGVHSTGYAIAGDGSIVRRVSSLRLFAQTPQVLAVNDLQGRPLERYQDSVARQKLTAGVISTPTVSLHPDVPGPIESVFNGYRTTRDVFVQLTSSPPERSDLSWYFVRRLGLIAAYNNRSARLAGWIGPDGFSASATPPMHRFDGALRPISEYAYVQPVIAFRSAVYRLDLHDRGIRKVFSASAGETVLGAATSGDSAAAMSIYGPRAKFEIIATNTNIYVQTADGTSELTAARTAGDSINGTVIVSRALLATGTPTFFWFSTPDRPFIDSEPGVAAGQITEFGDGSKVVARISIPRDTSPTAESKVSAGDVFSASGVPITWRLVPRALRAYRRLTGSLTAAPRKWRRSDTVDWIVSALASLIAFALAFALSGMLAFDRNRRLLWAVLGFVLGPLGVLLMLAMVDSPVRETCPACGRKRVVTRVRCERCDAAWPSPAPDGTEVFATSTS